MSEPDSSKYVLTDSIALCFARYFGAARDLPGVRELFEQQRKYIGCLCTSEYPLC